MSNYAVLLKEALDLVADQHRAIQLGHLERTKLINLELREALRQADKARKAIVYALDTGNERAAHAD